MDPKTINWKVVAAVLIALGYVAYRNKGFKHLAKALSKHGTVGAVLGIVAYFGWDYVFKRVQQEVPSVADDELPPQMGPQQSLSGYGSIEEHGLPNHMQGHVTGPGGYAASPALGC